MTVPRILVVDDDDDLRELICDYLDANGLEAVGAGNARAMDNLLASEKFDCIVLDLMMPGEDGLSVLRRLGEADRPSIIMLSAMGTDVDRIVGLELGADDYVAKPCNPLELLARIRALIRRNEHTSSALIRQFGPWTLDLVGRILSRGGEAVGLTDGEFRVLAIFLDHPRTLLTRDRLLDLSKGVDADVIDRSIDVTISRLRKKLGPDTPIRTVRSEGYVFELPGEQ